MTGAAGWRLRLPPVIGHRGAAGLAPENTLAAMRAAGQAGAGWVEFDVRLSRDLECMVIHDATLARTTGRRAPVSRTRS
ncbi:MAG: glycerophosphodiester phosphodiesterase, partial [Rhodospirillales bacterium]